MGHISIQGYEPTLHELASINQRFWAKVDIPKYRTDFCWEWLAQRTQGYGAFHIKGVTHSVKAHRVAYMLLVGPIPDGLVLDHLCRNTGCVNPAHLEPVTQAENTRRGAIGDIMRAHWASQTHCLRGHEFTEENTYRPPGDPRQRQCRACKAERDRQRRLARAAEVA